MQPQCIVHHACAILCPQPLSFLLYGSPQIPLKNSATSYSTMAELMTLRWPYLLSAHRVLQFDTTLGVVAQSLHFHNGPRQGLVFSYAICTTVLKELVTLTLICKSASPVLSAIFFQFRCWMHPNTVHPST